MKTILNYISESNTSKNYVNENFQKTNIDLYQIAKVSVPGKKRKVGIAIYNFENFNDEQTIIDFDDQIIFNYYCLYKWGVPYQKFEELHQSWVPVTSFDPTEKKKYDFYFDDVECVNSATSETIPGVRCDGSMTFAEGRKVLEDYFGI